jgi:hypothetical protein
MLYLCFICACITEARNKVTDQSPEFRKIARRLLLLQQLLIKRVSLVRARLYSLQAKLRIDEGIERIRRERNG